MFPSFHRLVNRPQSTPPIAMSFSVQKANLFLHHIEQERPRWEKRFDFCTRCSPFPSLLFSVSLFLCGCLSVFFLGSYFGCVYRVHTFFTPPPPPLPGHGIMVEYLASTPAFGFWIFSSILILPVGKMRLDSRKHARCCRIEVTTYG